jgi:hypothetical protein
MVMDPAVLLARSSGLPVRRYSTFDFGRAQDDQCFSVLASRGRARSLVYDLRKGLPPGLVAFLGTTRWLGDEPHEGVAEVVIGPGRTQFDILRIARTDACNHDMDTEDLIKKLQSWHDAFGIDIFHAETDTVELTLDNYPADIGAFANEAYAFCPDTVDQGVGSVDALAKSIKDYKQLSLWWD